MTTPEKEAYLAEQTKEMLALIHTPGSRIFSKKTGKKRLVIGDYHNTFLLTVRTNPDGSQILEPILSGKLPKVARVIAEGRDYDVIPLEKSEKPTPKELKASDFQIGSFIISGSGTIRMITDIQGDAVTTIKKTMMSLNMNHLA